MTTPVRHEKGHIEVGRTRDKKVPVKLYYEKTGSGPKKLLLIMGLNSPGSAWDTVVSPCTASLLLHSGCKSTHSTFATENMTLYLRKGGFF